MVEFLLPVPSALYRLYFIVLTTAPTHSHQHYFSFTTAGISMKTTSWHAFNMMPHVPAKRRPDHCIGGQCESICPQHIKIIDELEVAHEDLLSIAANLFFDNSAGQILCKKKTGKAAGLFVSANTKSRQSFPGYHRRVFRS